MPPASEGGLTPEQARFAMQQMSRWLRIRIQHQPIGRTMFLSGQMLNQVAADVDHSALLLRLLQGKEPLPEPPPLDHAYPVYPDE